MMPGHVLYSRDMVMKKTGKYGLSLYKTCILVRNSRKGHTHENSNLSLKEAN